MKVYIITSNDIEDHSPDYVFSTLEKAKAFLAELEKASPYRSYRWIDTMVVDDTTKERFQDED